MSPLARALGAFTLLVSVSGWAAHPLVTDDTGTQGAAGWQLEVTADHLFNRDADGHLSERTNALTLTRGLTDSTDLGVSMPWLSR
ncbi:MAG: transporter, partial [Burkholderiaceae bacterium]